MTARDGSKGTHGTSRSLGHERRSGCLYGIGGMMTQAAAAQSLVRSSTRSREGMLEVPGGRVFFRVVGDGPGAPLIVVHGGPGFPHDYLANLAELGASRPVVLYDQLGCGRSDRPQDPSLWRLERFVEELARLRDEIGAPTVHLLGHSWGSMLAFDFARAHASHVASLVLDSPILSMARFRADTAALRAALPEGVRATMDRHEAAGTLESEEYQQAIMAFMARHVLRLEPWPEPVQRSLEGMSHDVYSVMWGPNELMPIGNLSGYERMAELPDVRLPVAYVVGRHDEVRPDAARAFHEATQGSELFVLEESAHLKNLEEPGRYLAVVDDFLRRHDPPR